MIELIVGDAQSEQQMLELADGLIRGEYRQDVKPECGGELKARQDEDALEQAPILSETALLLIGQPAELLKKLQLTDLLLHLSIPGDGIVVGERHDIQAAGLAAVKDVQVCGLRFLEITRGGCM